jgi:hypothetical protein
MLSSSAKLPLKRPALSFSSKPAPCSPPFNPRSLYTDKNENQIFLIYEEIQFGAADPFTPPSPGLQCYYFFVGSSLTQC